MKDTDQIAAEAADEFARITNGRLADHDQLKAIIKSAFEEATEDRYDSGYIAACRAAHASAMGADDTSGLLKIASEMLSAGVFLSTFREDQDKLKRRDFIKIAENQQERLRLWAIDISAIARRSRAAHASEQDHGLLEWAWAIIANAGAGNWERESKDWQEAAAKWRDEAYHPALAKAKEGK